MTIQELFILSNQELLKVIQQIREDQWDLVLVPPASSRSMTLRQAVNYHAHDDAWVPDVLAGKTKEEVGRTYDAILETTDSLSEYARYNARAIDAVRVFDELDITTHLSYGDFSARDYLQHITSFRAFRVYDISKLLGASTKMDETFVQGLWDEFAPVIEGYRQMGVFPAALPAPDSADLQTKLLALVGRKNN